MTDLSNSGLQQQLEKVKSFYKRFSIIIVTILAIIIFVAVKLYFKSSSTNSTIKNLVKENKELKKEQEEMRKKFTTDSLQRVEIQNEISIARQERDILLVGIKNTNNLLTKFKPQYEKINNYQSVPANDSLARLFNQRFGWPAN